MSAISAEAVKKLRDMTSLPMMECKTALTEAGGDMEKAITILRERNAKAQIKRADREAAEGRIAAHVDEPKQVGAIIEVRCESPMVVKSEQFIALAKELAEHVAYHGPKTVEEMLLQPFAGDVSKRVQDRINEAIGLIRENMKVARFVRMTGSLGEYCHHDGSVGVLLQVSGKADRQLLREVCMHIVAAHPTPIAVKRDEVPAEVIAKERDIAKGQTATDPKNAGKPANIIEKIVEGKLNAWLKDNVLIDQPFVRDPSRTVGQVLKAAGVEPVKFVRLKVGETSGSTPL
jgi:elongation factor Ts